MKILVHGDGRIVYGAERQAVFIAEGLLRRGHEVMVSCPPDCPFEELLHARAIPTTNVRPRGNLDLLSHFQFMRWIRAERPDAFLATSWKRALAVGWAARRAGVSRIALRVGSTHPRGTRTGEWRRQRTVARYTDALIGNSGAVGDFLAERFPDFPRPDIHVVWNAVEVEDTTGGTIRRDLNIGNAPLLLAVGALVRRKAFDVLLDAFAALPDQAAHLAVAGSGPLEAALKGQCAALGLDRRVHWLGHRADVPRLLGAADAFVMTSRHEGTPNSLLEAISAGIPVISTPAAGTEVALASAGGRAPAGWLVPFDQPQVLTDAMARVLDPSSAARVEVRARVEEARWRAQHWFSVDRMVTGYESVLRGGRHYDDTEYLP